jgi:hypothetical protein
MQMSKICYTSTENFFVIKKCLLLLLSLSTFSFAAEFEVVTVVLLRIHFFWDVTFCDPVTHFISQKT